MSGSGSGTAVGPVGAGSRVLVTGGDGFLGRHLVAALAERGARVLVVDDGRVARDDVPAPAGVRRLRLDFRSDEALDAARELEATTVFHLAAMHFVPDCDRDPTACLDLNVLGTERLLGALRETGVQSVVFCSSAVVYGFADTPRREDDPLRPQHVYAQSKWLGEGLLRGLSRDRPDVRTVSARLFNLYGPGDTARHVVPVIVDAVAQGRELSLGNVWPRRDYVHITDVAQALLALAEGPVEATAVNVGTGEGRSVADVLDVVGTVLGRPPRVVRDPARERAVDGHLVADPGLLRATTDWQPRWSFEDGLRALLAGAGAA